MITNKKCCILRVKNKEPNSHYCKKVIIKYEECTKEEDVELNVIIKKSDGTKFYKDVGNMHKLKKLMIGEGYNINRLGFPQFYHTPLEEHDGLKRKNKYQIDIGSLRSIEQLNIRNDTQVCGLENLINLKYISIVTHGGYLNPHNKDIFCYKQIKKLIKVNKKLNIHINSYNMRNHEIRNWFI